MLWLISLYFSLHEWKLLRKSSICQRLCDIDSLCENLIPIIVSFVNTYLTKKNNFTAAITWEPHPPELFTWLLAPVWQKGARLHGGRPIKYLSNSLYSRFVVYFCCSYARLDHEVYQNDINNSHVQHLKTTSKKSVFFQYTVVWSVRVLMELLAMSVRPVKLLLNSTTTNSTLYWVGISTSPSSVQYILTTEGSQVFDVQ